MRKLAVLFFFYMILAVLLLPLAVTLVFGGFGRGLPREAKAAYELAAEPLPQDPQGIDFEKAE